MKSNVTAVLIKKLRERTGIGFLECKRALLEENGDLELSIDNLRKTGKLRAEKKINNITNSGKIFALVENKIGVLLELKCETDFVANDSSFIDFGQKIVKSIISENIRDINDLNFFFKDLRTDLITKIDENITIKRFFVLDGANVISYVHGVRIGVLVDACNLNRDMIKNIAMHIAASKPEYLYPEDVAQSVMDREYKIQIELSKKLNKSSDILKKIIDGKMKKFVNSIALTGQNFIFEPHHTVGDVLSQNNGTILSFVRFEIGHHAIFSKQ